MVHPRNANANTNATVYEVCNSLLPETLNFSQSDKYDYMLQCIGNSHGRSIDTFFLLYASTILFFMQAGFAMLCAGCVQSKNIQNSMLKNLLDACGSALGYFSIGYAFSYGGSNYSDSSKTFIGTENFFLSDVDDLMFWMFQFAFAASSATIVAGTLAERCQMAAYFYYSLVVTGFVYPVVAHAVWSPQGFLNAHNLNPLWGVGMIDFAGSSVVHLTGGHIALLATCVLGPRKGRFHDLRGKLHETPMDFPGHSSALQMLGTFILWFGWYGFNTGSALSIAGPGQDKVVSLVAVNTTLAAATGCISSLITDFYINERKSGEGVYSMSYAMNGCLAGLVSVTGACGVVEPWAAVIIGFIAGLLYLGTSKLLIRFCIDDVVDAIPVHMTNGIWGTIAVGLFASPDRLQLAFGKVNDAGLFMGGAGVLFASQIIGILFIIGWTCFIMLPFFFLLNYQGWLRASSFDEMEGLDSLYHIKSKKLTSDQIREITDKYHGNEMLRRNIDSFEGTQQTPQRNSANQSLPVSRGCDGNWAEIRSQCRQ